MFKKIIYLLCLMISANVCKGDWNRDGENLVEFFVSTSAVTYSQAEQECQKLHATIASLETGNSVEQVYIKSRLQYTDVYFAHLSGWIEGPSSSGCPTISKNNTTSLITRKPCSEAHRFICNRTIGNSWGQWSGWSTCEKCFEQNITRTRDCLLYNPNGTNYCQFSGERWQQQLCNQGSCRKGFVDFQTGTCNATCGQQGWTTEQVICKENRTIPTNCKGLLLKRCTRSCNTTKLPTTTVKSSTKMTTSPTKATTNRSSFATNLTTAVSTSNNSLVNPELTTVGIVPVGRNMYIIVACVIGALFVVVILIVGIACFMKKKRYAKQVISSVPGASVHPNSNHESHEMDSFNDFVPTPNDLEANGQREPPDGSSNQEKVVSGGQALKTELKLIKFTVDNSSEGQEEEPNDIYDRVPDEDPYESADDMTTKFVFPPITENNSSPTFDRTSSNDDYDEIKETTTEKNNQLSDKNSGDMVETPLLQENGEDQCTTTSMVVDEIGYDTMEEVQAEMTKLQIKQGVSTGPKTLETMTIPRKFAPGTIPNEVNYDEVVLKESARNNNIGEPNKFQLFENTDDPQSAYEQIPPRQDNTNGYEDVQDIREAYDNLPAVKSSYSSLSLDRIHPLSVNVPSERQFATMDSKNHLINKTDDVVSEKKIVDNVAYNGM